MKKIGLTLFLFLFTNLVFASKIATFPDLLKPGRFIIDGKQIFITEGITIRIYSLEDFSLQKKFGKMGEGPGEFLKHAVVYVHPHHLIVNSSGKVSFFTRDGIYKREMKVPFGFWYNSIGDRYVGYAIIDEKDAVYTGIFLYDSNFQKIIELNRYKFWFQQNKEINPVAMSTPRFYICDNKIITMRGEEGIIDIHDNSGKKLLSITHNYKKLKLTDDHKKKYHYFLSKISSYKAIYGGIKKWIKFPDYFPIIQRFNVSGSIIYVLTFNREGNKSEFFLFNMKGEFLKKLMVPFAVKDPVGFYPYYINNGKLYQLIENEETDLWELHVKEIK